MKLEKTEEQILQEKAAAELLKKAEAEALEKAEKEAARLAQEAKSLLKKILRVGRKKKRHVRKQPKGPITI